MSDCPYDESHKWDAYLARMEDKPTTLTSPAIEALEEGLTLLNTLNLPLAEMNKLSFLLNTALLNEKAKEAKRLAQQFSK